MHLTLVLFRTAGAPAVRRAIPLYLGLLAIAAVLFGPTGMHPTTVTEGARHAPTFRLILWVAWLLSAAPATRAVLREDALDYIRWLPLSTAHICAVLGGLLLAIQTPWVLLFAVGGGAEQALAALWFAAGIHAVIAIRPRGNTERGLQIAVLSASGLILAITPAYAHALVGLGLWLVAVPMAWRRAPERHVHRGSMRILPGKALALAQCHLAGVWRRQPGMLVRAIIITALAAGATWLLARANQPNIDQLASFSAVVLTVGFAVAVVGIVRSASEAEQALTWVVDSAGIPPGVRVAARLVEGVVIGVALGAVYSGLVGWALDVEPVAFARLSSGAVGMGVAMSFLARRITRFSERKTRGRGRGADRRTHRVAVDTGGGGVVAMMIVVVVAEFFIIGLFGDLAVIVSLACAFALSWERA